MNMTSSLASSKTSRKDKIFYISLAQIRLKLVIINAVLIGLALGIKGGRIDYAILFAYFCINLLCLIIPTLRFIAQRTLHLPLLAADLIVTGYMMYRTGGEASALYPFLFIPVLIAILRYRTMGILFWCTLMSAIYAIASLIHGNPDFYSLSIKVIYLYMAGFIGGHLVGRNYTVTEEISKKLARWNIELQRLNTFSLEVTGSSDLDEIFNQTLKIVLQRNPSQMVAITMFTEHGDLKIFASYGWDETWQELYKRNPLSINSFTLAPIIVFKNPLLCPDIKKHHELTKIFEGIPVESLSAFPLVVDNEVVGALMITGATVRKMPDEEVGILSSIASQASVAIQNVVSLKQEKKKADTDGLTGLYNRRYFNEQIVELAEKALVQGTPLSLILLDVDFFKKYNDTNGHPAGDLLLKTIAVTIGGAVREEDIVARYGGEEFAIILRNATNQLALHIAERVRRAVEKLPQGTLKSSVTISVGVGTIPANAQDHVSLIDFADKSLYHAKHSGRNKVCCGFME